MPNIVLPYIPAPGDNLDIEELSKNFYAPEADLPVGTLSLYETSNGNITFPDNFHASFDVRSHHVRPWQVADAAHAGLTEPVDFYEDAWGANERFYGIAGANLTFYQKYDTSMSLFLCSAFFSTWRQRGALVPESEPPEYDNHPIRVRMYMDGVPVRHTLRDLPTTVYFGETGYGFDYSREQILTRAWNLHHMKYPGGNAGKGHDALLKGWHSFGLGIYIEANGSSETVAPVGEDIVAAYDHPIVSFDALHRVRAYVRSATTLRLL